MLYNITIIALKILRKIFRRNINPTNCHVEFADQIANDLIADFIRKNKCGMISKFGSIELGQVVTEKIHLKGIDINDIIHHIRGDISIDFYERQGILCKNAGVFPIKDEIVHKFCLQVIKDCQNIDILGSYLWEEEYLSEELISCKRVNLEAFYAPFLWDKPWSLELRNKRVLIISPFVDSIKQQYMRRKLIWGSKNVIPDFSELLFIKAVQSQAFENTNFSDWFEALDYMKNEIDKLIDDFDVALIGCGAYGMSLAAYVKTKGKLSIHLGGWLQFFFGIYGNRWIKDQPEYARFINDAWVRPNENEKISNPNIVENGCYW